MAKFALSVDKLAQGSGERLGDTSKAVMLYFMAVDESIDLPLVKILRGERCQSMGSEPVSVVVLVVVAIAALFPSKISLQDPNSKGTPMTGASSWLKTKAQLSSSDVTMQELTSTTSWGTKPKEELT